MSSIQVEPAMDPKPSASEVSFKETWPEQPSAASADLSEEKFVYGLSLIHISEPTRQRQPSRMPSSA